MKRGTVQVAALKAIGDRFDRHLRQIRRDTFSVQLAPSREVHDHVQRQMRHVHRRAALRGFMQPDNCSAATRAAILNFA